MGKYLENIKLKLNDNNILINILIILAIFSSPLAFNQNIHSKSY